MTRTNFKKVLLLDTAVGTSNMGDEIINLSIKKNWSELFHNNYLINLPTHTLQYSLFQKMIYKQKMELYKNADYKFLCGTNALYVNMLRPMPNWNITPLNCQLVQGTICLGVGIGTNGTKANYYTRKLYDKVLNHDYIHSVRDEKAKIFLEDLGFQALNTGCPTLWGLNEEHCKNIRTGKAGRVVFTLTNYIRDEENDRLMIECLLRNYEEVFFWPQCIADLEYMYSLGDFSKVKIIPPNLEAYENILNTEIDYVGNRLHGGIFALQHSCRTIIIEIDYRVREMNETYTLPSIKRTEIGSQLNDMINSNWTTKTIGIDSEIINKWKAQFEIEMD